MAVGSAAASIKLDPGGLNTRFSVGLSEQASVTVGYGFNNYSYGRQSSPIPEVFTVEAVRADIITVGTDYAFAHRPLRPFAGGGAALAREYGEADGHSATDWYGGLYVEGGVRYFLGGKWAVAGAARYTYLFDEAVLAYDINKPGKLLRSENRTQLLDLLVGINYYF